MRLKQFIEARKIARNPAKINLRNILAVIQAWFRKKRRSMGGFDLPDHIYEQIIYRRTQVVANSPKCWIYGSCIECGCEILGKTMEDRGCERGCYPGMMNEKQWKSYKSLMKIKLFE
jgi:hypothetical protein